jgi:hypothetical protein
MRNRRKTRETLSVSLFPFLAVLICTLGVLIVLLVLAVKSADVNAQKVRQEKSDQQQSEFETLKDQLEVRQIQIEGLKQVRPEAVKRLHESRNHRGYLEQEIRELKDKARRLAMELRSIDEIKAANTPIESDSEKIEQLANELAQARTELEENRKNKNSFQATTYSIVPHEGTGGTDRRPIFVECTREELILQPLGVRLAKSDFALPLENGNMLDSALLAIREYWEQYGLTGEQRRPYPLLVVRPGGAGTFVLARHAMKSWDDEFGYELVEASKQLEFGTADPQLRERVETAIREAEQRQQIRLVQQRRLAAAYASDGRFGHSHPPGISASGRMGGFVSTENRNVTANRLVENLSQNTNGNAKPFGGYFEALKNEGEGRGKSDSSARQQQSNQQVSEALTGTQQQRSGPGPPQDTESQQTDGNAPTPLDFQAQSPYQSMSLAQSRGKNWALPSKTAGATAYVRPIRVVCGPKELEVHSVLGAETTISTEDGMEAAVDPLVNAIWQQIESWGVAGGGSYWKPELRISVISGGELNFEKLRGLLDSSGVSLRKASQ